LGEERAKDRGEEGLGAGELGGGGEGVEREGERVMWRGTREFQMGDWRSDIFLDPPGGREGISVGDEKR
jgi:hypothetical protein